MGEHYNLYYILLEDQQRHPLPAPWSEMIQKDIEKICREKESPSPLEGYEELL